MRWHGCPWFCRASRIPCEPAWIRSYARKVLALVQALEADSIRLQHEMVASGGGFAITAGTLEARDARRLAAVRIVRPSLTRAIVLGVTKHRPNTLATRSVGALLRSMAS